MQGRAAVRAVSAGVGADVLSAADVRSDRIDVFAQYSLIRLSKER
jgi:hypothetical protein